MKKNYSICFVLFLLCGFSFFSCQQDLDEITKQENADLITDAKAFFEQEITVKTRSDKDLPLGDFAPLWDKAKVSRDQFMEGVDIPIVSTYSYYTIRKEVIGGRNRSYIANITEKAVVVKSAKNGSMGLYRMLVVPDYAYYQTNKGDLSGRFTNFGDKENFSGIIFYLAVDGMIPLRADTYKDGAKVSELSLFVNDFETYKQNLMELAKMLPALKVYRQSNLATTRSGWEDPWGDIGWDDPWGDDGDYWSGDAGDNGNWTSIGNGFYHDGKGNIGYDYTGDGNPDGVWIPEVDITPDEGDPEPPGWDDGDLPDPTPPTTSGGGGGGGSTTPTTPVAPKAQEIFRNSGMSDTNWKVIERMLEKIMEDCMGEALYNGLKTYLNGKTLIIQFNNGTSGSFSSNGISLGIQAESNQLFHEMMHAYRTYKETLSSYNSSTLNGEIEAHYAQYLYVSKLPEYPNSKWEKRNYTDVRYGKIKDLENFISPKGSLKSGVNLMDLETKILNEVVPALRAGGYSVSNYNFDYNRLGLENFSNIRELTINCN